MRTFGLLTNHPGLEAFRFECRRTWCRGRADGFFVPEHAKGTRSHIQSLIEKGVPILQWQIQFKPSHFLRKKKSNLPLKENALLDRNLHIQLDSLNFCH